jgi:hypothetical protein
MKLSHAQEAFVSIVEAFLFYHDSIYWREDESEKSHFYQ